MQVTLQVSSGPLKGRIIFLKAGQRAEVGRTEWADFTFPHDSEMADVHFVIDCRAGECTIRDLNTATGTLVEGQPITQTRLTHGAEILAGSTRFRVSIDGPGTTSEPAARASSSAEAPPNAFDETPSHGPLATEYCQVLELEDESQAILNAAPKIAATGFLMQLVERELLVDAIRFKAQMLPKRDAILWALQCVRTVEDNSPKKNENQKALNAVDQWLADPTEENRRKAEAAARTLNYETPAAWAAMTVFWSEGSLTPPETEVVPPAEHLTGVAASAALLMAAALGPAVEVAARHQQFLQMSEPLSSGP